MLNKRGYDMIKTFSFLFLFLTLASCGKSGGGSSTSQGEALSLDEISVDSNVPAAAHNFEVNLKINNFDAAQEDKVLEAADLIKKVVATEEFKDAILNFTYNGKKAFSDNDGLSNAEIYKKILEGSERLQPGADNEMDLSLEIFTRSDDTVGYTFPNELRVWMNSKFLNKNTPAKVTTNMMHEWLHKLGFKHDSAKTAKRPYSVPYAVGYLVARIAQKLI